MEELYNYCDLALIANLVMMIQGIVLFSISLSSKWLIKFKNSFFEKVIDEKSGLKNIFSKIVLVNSLFALCTTLCLFIVFRIIEMDRYIVRLITFVISLIYMFKSIKDINVRFKKNDATKD